MEKIKKISRSATVILGLVMIAANYCIIPLVCRLLDKDSDPLGLPMEFWILFGATTGLYDLVNVVKKRWGSK